MATQTGTATYDFAGLEGIWDQAGGNAQAAGWAAAIAMAESGGQVFAHSPTNDVGLWQINATYHPPSQATYDVMGNARAAIAISQDGKDWGPWCTAWANPSGNCGSYLGPTPQRGSPAYAFYLKYSGTPPDMTIALNGTNAAANNALTVAPVGLLCKCTLTTPWCCDVTDIPGFGQLTTDFGKGIVEAILGPLLAPIVGVMGMAAGGVIIMFGIFLIVRGTDTYQSAKQAVGEAAGAGLTAAGFATGQPELLAAGGATGGIGRRAGAAGRQRITTIRGQQVQQRFGERSQVIQQRQYATQAEVTRQQEIRGRTRTAEQLRYEASLYRRQQARRRRAQSAQTGQPQYGDPRGYR